VHKKRGASKGDPPVGGNVVSGQSHELDEECLAAIACDDLRDECVVSRVSATAAPCNLCAQRQVGRIAKTNDVLTVEELAARLKVPASWVYSHADGLRAYRLGKYIRFSWILVQQRLSAGAIPAAARHA
jgi:hypothetical protein